MFAYIYCIAERLDEIDIKGIRACDVNILSYEKLSIVYSIFTEKIDSEEVNYFAHEHVLEAFMQRNVAILPFRFGTHVFKTDCSRILTENYKSFHETIQFLKGKVEISIRGLWRREDVAKELVGKQLHKEIKCSNYAIQSYLEVKLQKHRTSNTINSFAHEQVTAIHNELVEIATHGKNEVLKTDEMFFSGVYLVEKDKQNDFVSMFNQIKKLYSDYNFIISGPWPPYNFCNLIIE